MLKRTLAAAVLLAGTMTPLLPIAGAPAVSAVTCTVTVRLSPGVNNGAVKCLEQRLRELAYSVGTPDSVYDAASVNAVKSFQRTRGLYPDGIITSITGRQLGLRGALPPAGSAAVTVLGDSTSAAMRWYDEARNETAIYDIMGTTYDLKWSVESCRRLVAASCVGRTDPGTGLRWRPVSVLPEMRGALKGRLGNAIVIMAGYDDYPSLTGAIDSIVGEAEAQGVARVFWLNYRTTSTYGYGTYYQQHNAALAAAKARHPNLVVLDWNGYTRGQSTATQRAWFERDDIHMTRAGGVALARYLKANIDASAVRGCTTARATAGTVIDMANPLATPDASPTGFTPTSPTPVYDSVGRLKVGAGRAVRVDLSTLAPPTATSAAITVAAIDPCLRGRIVAYASSGSTCGPTPGTTTVQFESGRTSSGMAITSLSNRALCVYSTAPTDLAVSVTGWFASDSSGMLHTTGVTRWVDTRSSTTRSQVRGKIPAGGSRSITIGGVSPVPADATAVLVNTTLLAPAATTRALIYPGNCSTAPPNSFSVAANAGRTTAATTIVKLGADGTACLRMSSRGGAEVVVDVLGWFDADPAGGRRYVALAPAAVLNTTLPASAVVMVPGSIDVAPLLTVTASNGAGGNLTVRSCGSTALALLYPMAGEPVTNAGVVTPSAGQGVCISSSVATSVRVERSGRFDLVPS